MFDSHRQTCLRWLSLLAWPILFHCLPGLSADDFPAVRNGPSEAHLEPMSATEAAARMRVPAGFRVELFASEPEVQNPIAMAWDQRGRLWVAENYTYSDRTQRFDLSMRDRVLMFEDRDNDGRADRRTVFTDQVQMLTSVEVGNGGVWLMCPPQLLFIPDEDGDGQPDGPARVMLDGFEVAQSNYHNFANGLRWGPDGWLYGRCGHSCPGRLGPPGTPDELRIPIDGGIWRYHPRRQVVEVVCHGTVNPWGHDWDQHGELFFINTVIGHLWHAIPGAHFKESFGESKNPHVYERLDMIADHFHFDTSSSWTASRDGKANDHGGGHAHIGMMIYQSDHWPAKYRNRLFTLNMHGQRANVERLERTRVGYVGRHEPDFLIAEDPFFRGLEISTGPDGNVFVLDWSDTGECHDHTGVHRTSGRIFKISFGDSASVGPVYKPACLGGAGTLPKLWKQYQAGTIENDSLRGYLSDPDEHVRAWAIRLLTDFWPLDTITGPRRDARYPDDPQTRELLVSMAREDPSGLVHLTLASTLQRLPIGHRLDLARELVRHKRHAGDRDLPLMVWFGLIPVAEANPEQLAALADDVQWPTLLGWMTRYLASRTDSDPEPLNALLEIAGAREERFQVSVLEAMVESFKGWRSAPEPDAWSKFARTRGATKHPDSVRELSRVFGDGRALVELKRIALDGAAELKLRQRALQSYINARPADLRSVCESLMNSRIVNATAAQGLALFNDERAAALLVASYRRFHPDDKPQLLALLASRPLYAKALLAQVGHDPGRISPADISPFLARQIRALDDPEVNANLANVWGELRDSPADRRALMQTLRDQLTSDQLQRADLVAGRQLFNRSCSQCHMLHGQGQRIGPDLTGSQRSNLDYLLENLVDPSAVVGKDYRMTIVTTVDGRVFNGLVVSQDRKTLVLQTATDRINLQSDAIEELRRTTLSAMPDGLLANLTSQQVRDLIAYLMHPGQVGAEVFPQRDD